MVIHVQAIKKLALADYLLIEEEHARLERLLHGLHETCCNLDKLLSCQGCDSGELASCLGRLPSYIHDLIDHVDKHFYHEESIISGTLDVTVKNDYFKLHQQTHDSMVQELNSMLGECHLLKDMEKTDESYHHLYKKFSDQYEEHSRAFDDPFIQSTLA